MEKAYDNILQTVVSAKNAALNSDNEAFRYECLCCGEEVFLAAQDSVYKATHFRHRSGNNDKDCELYLGQYGIVPFSPSANRKRQDRIEFYYQNAHKAFYMSFRFNDAEITAYEEDGSSIEVRTTRAGRPFFIQKISRTFFCDDVPEMYMIDTYSTQYFISNTTNNIKREYNLFSDIAPTFFKVQGEGTDFTAKYIKSKSVYTNTKYFIAWPGQNTAQIRLSKTPGVQIEDLFQFKTMNNCTTWAMIATFTDKNPQLDSLIQSWGFDLNFSEELTLLWPPAYERDEVFHVSSNSIFIYSSFALQAAGNTNAPVGSIHAIDTNLTRVSVNDKLRVLKKNAEISVIVANCLAEFDENEVETIYANRFIVPNEGIFYRYSLSGVERLAPGQIVFLTKTSSVIQYHGNYILKIILKPLDTDVSLSKKIRDAMSYYWVTIPYKYEELENFSEYVAEYLAKCNHEARINKAVKLLIEEEKHG